jgi:hypothetical protein
VLNCLEEDFAQAVKLPQAEGGEATAANRNLVISVVTPSTFSLL